MPHNQNPKRELRSLLPHHGKRAIGKEERGKKKAKRPSVPGTYYAGSLAAGGHGTRGCVLGGGHAEIQGEGIYDLWGILAQIKLHLGCDAV